jgi:hypothetical protein
MINNVLKKIFEFLEEKEQQNPPFKWKLLNNKPLLEDDLDIKGDLNLLACDVKSLPEGLKVGGSLVLEYSTIQKLPEGLKVGGNLSLYYCKHLTSLPKGLKVGGDLVLNGCVNIKTLPKGLEVHSGLFINNTALLEYTDEQLREMVKPGFIKEKIYRQ